MKLRRAAFALAIAARARGDRRARDGREHALDRGPVGSGKASATKSVCGLGTGKKATGTPIKIGGIATS